MQNAFKIRRVTIFHRGFELDLLGRFHCGFVESMTKAPHYFHDVDLAVGGENHINKNFTFDFKLASFISVNRTRLISDLGR